MTDWFGWVAIVSLLAVVTMPSCREVAALEAHAAGNTTGQFVQFHVESTAPRVLIALAGCEQKTQISSSNR